MAATVASDHSDGPVLSVINKRIRALRKKYNRIIQMEESVSQGKALNKEQEETLRSKPYVIAGIDELEKLKQPLSVAVSEEITAAIQRQQLNTPISNNSEENFDNSSNKLDEAGDEPDELDNKCESNEREAKEIEGGNGNLNVVEDLLKLLYFGSIFDVKSQSDFTAMMLTRTVERSCCLTYDTVTDDDADPADLLGEKDLDLISMLGSLLISRPVNSSLSHKNALLQCVEHAKFWLAKSVQPIEPNSSITYSGLREKLNKIMASDYFTTTPEMRAPVEVAAAAGNYGSFQVPVQGSVLPVKVSGGQIEGFSVQFENEDEETLNFQGNDNHDSHSSPVEEFHQGDGEENFSELPGQTEPVMHQGETEQNLQESEKEQQYAQRRSYQNYRGGRGANGSGRRGYPNGRGGRGNSRGGSYLNGRSQYYDQPGNYYPRNNYYRGRGGGRVSGGGGGSHNYHPGQSSYSVPES